MGDAGETPPERPSISREQKQQHPVALRAEGGEREGRESWEPTVSIAGGEDAARIEESVSRSGWREH